MLFLTECCYTVSCDVVLQKNLAIVVRAWIIMVAHTVTAAGDDSGCLT